MAGAYFTRVSAINRRRNPPKLLTIAARLAFALGAIASGIAGCEETFDGPPEILPVQFELGADATLPPTLVPIADRDTVSLTRPIQGGHVLFIGARVRNISDKGASVLGELRRSKGPDGTPLSQPGGVLYSDERSVTVEQLADGWKQVVASPNDMANIPGCPNLLDVDIVDNPLFLVVRYTDGKGRTATAARAVTPRCLDADAAARRSCVCECQARYTVDRCTGLSSPDGGAPDM